MVPKEKMTLAEKLKILDDIATTTNTRSGKVIVGRLNNPEIMDKLTIKYVKTPSLNLNEAMGGGFPKGRMTIVSGMPDSGKTSLVLEAIGKNMKEDESFVAGWLEGENSLEIDYLQKTFGIDPERFFYIEHEKKGAAESAIDLVEGALSTGAFDLFAINSLKSLVPSEEFKKDMGSMQVGLLA